MLHTLSERIKYLIVVVEQLGWCRGAYLHPCGLFSIKVALEPLVTVITVCD